MTTAFGRSARPCNAEFQFGEPILNCEQKATTSESSTDFAATKAAYGLSEIPASKIVRSCQSFFSDPN